MGDHDGLESVITIPWNAQTNSKMIAYNFKVFHAIERTVRSLRMTARAS